MRNEIFITSLSIYLLYHFLMKADCKINCKLYHLYYYVQNIFKISYFIVIL